MYLYQKKPITIEAHIVPQRGEYPSQDLIDFLDGVPAGWEGDDEGITILNLRGPRLLASPGDYIIKGTQGEYYPCKPDLFVASYTKV